MQPLKNRYDRNFEPEKSCPSRNRSQQSPSFDPAGERVRSQLGIHPENRKLLLLRTERQARLEIVSEKNPLKVTTNIKGFQDNKITVISDYKGKISKQSNYLSISSEGLINPLQRQTDKFEFLKKMNEKNYIIKKGKWFLNAPLVINGNLEIREDTQIEFSENSYIIVKGRINFLGTKLNPIIFKAKSKCLSKKFPIVL